MDVKDEEDVVGVNDMDDDTPGEIEERKNKEKASFPCVLRSNDCLVQHANLVVE